MLKNILNLEGATLLNKEQQKHIKGGGGPEEPYIRNLKATGDIIEYNGGVYACKCTWEVSENGKDGWEVHAGPCPPGELEYSCL